MIAEQEQYTCVQSTPELIKGKSHDVAVIAPSSFQPSDVDYSGLFEFAANAPATFAERHPRVAVLAISAAVLLSAIAVEIECLRGSGYFWR